MTYQNHPLFKGNSGVTSNPATAVASTQSCQRFTTGLTDVSHSVDFTGLLQDGDLILVVIICSLENSYARTEAPDDSWMLIHGTIPLGAAAEDRKKHSMYVKTWLTGEAESYTFTAVRTGNPEEQCVYATVFRNVSKVTPIDFHTLGGDVLTGLRGPAGGVKASMLAFPEPQAHSPPLGHPQFLWNISYQINDPASYWSSYTPDDWAPEPIDFTTGLVGPSGTAVGWHAWMPDQLTGTASTASTGAVLYSAPQIYLGLITTPKGRLQNLCGNPTPWGYNGGLNVDQGMSYTNIKEEGDYDGDYEAGLGDSYKWKHVYHDYDGIGNVERHASVSVSGVEVGDYVVAQAGLSWTDGLTGTTEHRMAPNLAAPDGSRYGGILDPRGWGSTSTPTYAAFPDMTVYSQSEATGYTGTNHANILFGQKAGSGQAGTWSFRINFMKTAASFAGFSYIGSSSTPTLYSFRNQGYQAPGLAVNQVPNRIAPCPAGADPSSFASANFCARPFYHFDPDSHGVWPENFWWPISTYTDDSRSEGNNQVWQLVQKDTSDWAPYQLTAVHSFTVTGSLTEDRLGVDTVPYGIITYTYGGFNTYILSYVAYTNRMMLPRYCATEEATSRTTGRYYCEYTVDENPDATDTSGNNARVMVVPIIYNPQTTVLLNSRLYTYYNWTGDIGGNGSTESTGNASWASGDIIGIAVDYLNSQIDFYHNGTLQDSVSMFDPSYTYSMMDQVPHKIVVVHALGSRADHNSGHFNFSGPFTYTKPTGFVAIDWQNEVT